jgi:hypothetical protein
LAFWTWAAVVRAVAVRPVVVEVGRASFTGTSTETPETYYKSTLHITIIDKFRGKCDEKSLHKRQSAPSDS